MIDVKNTRKGSIEYNIADFNHLLNLKLVSDIVNKLLITISLTLIFFQVLEWNSV